MQCGRHIWSALVLTVVAAAVVLTTGAQFRQMHRDEVIVPGTGVTQMRMLSDYLPALAGTTGDTEVYILEGEEPGPTAFILGGTHPNEPAGFMTAVVLVERAQVRAGRLVVVPRATGRLHNDPQEGSPQLHADCVDGSARRSGRISSHNLLTSGRIRYLHKPVRPEAFRQRESQSEQSVPGTTGRDPYRKGSLCHHGADT